MTGPKCPWWSVAFVETFINNEFFETLEELFRGT